MNTNKKFICVKCDNDIKTIVEKCLSCELFFHPCCIKFHKVLDDDDKKINCNGPYEKLNLRTTNKIEKSKSIRMSNGSIPINRKSTSIQSLVDTQVRHTNTVAVNQEINSKVNLEEVMDNISKKLEESLNNLNKLILEKLKSEIF